MTSDWAERTLCPDGACTGVIGSDGACRVCGRAAPFWGDERRRGMVADDEPAPVDLDPAGGAAEVDDDRELCPDGACTGLIGGDGTCAVCGLRGPARVRAAGAAVTRVVPPSVAAAAAAAAPRGDDDSDDRRLCPDGACVGLLDARGVCTTCGTSDEGN